MSFYDEVYRVVRLIPSGCVASYGDIAAVIGSPRAARQVGYALAGLDPKGCAKDGESVPWQRVVQTTGTIAFRGDPIRGDIQRALLVDEGIEFVEDRIPMHRFRWDPDVEDLC